MSKNYKKACKPIAIYQSLIGQDFKNPFMRSPTKTINAEKIPQTLFLNNSVCEKSIQNKIINLNESLVQESSPIHKKKRANSIEVSNMLGKFLNKAASIEDYIQKEFANIASLGSIPEQKVSKVNLQRDGNKKLLIVDLENVLIHIIDFRNTTLYSNVDINPKAIKTISYLQAQKNSYIFTKIVLRPFLEYFFTILKAFYQIVVCI